MFERTDVTSSARPGFQLALTRAGLSPGPLKAAFLLSQRLRPVDNVQLLSTQRSFLMKKEPANNNECAPTFKT